MHHQRQQAAFFGTDRRQAMPSRRPLGQRARARGNQPARTDRVLECVPIVRRHSKPAAACRFVPSRASGHRGADRPEGSDPPGRRSPPSRRLATHRAARSRDQGVAAERDERWWHPFTFSSTCAANRAKPRCHVIDASLKPSARRPRRDADHRPGGSKGAASGMQDEAGMIASSRQPQLVARHIALGSLAELTSGRTGADDRLELIGLSA
jgi:hypothetical protein